MTATICFISGPDATRSNVLQSFVAKSKDYSIVDPLAQESEIQIFSSSYIKELNISLSSAYFEYLQSSENLTIVDIDKNYFLDGLLGPLFTIAVISASFVTCADAALQEAIFEHTGRLAAIVENPIDNDEFGFPDAKTIVTTPKELDILWIGFAGELFSIRPYLKNDKYNIKTVLFSEYPKRVKSLLTNADIIFLPKTFTQADEVNRAVKVRESIMSGKFVVAPDLEFDYNRLAFDGSLEGGITFYMEGDVTKWITKKQKVLKDNCGFDHCYQQMLTALENAPKDTFDTTLNSYLNDGS